MGEAENRADRAVIRSERERSKRLEAEAEVNRLRLVVQDLADALLQAAPGGNWPPDSWQAKALGEWEGLAEPRSTHA